MINVSKLVLFFGLLVSGSAFAAEVKFGSNTLTCVNEDIGSFEIQFSVVDTVIDTEYYSAKNAQPIPSWETLESHLETVTFTAGKLVTPAGAKGILEGGELKVLRNVWKGSAFGVIELHLSFPKDSFLLDHLMIDHNHPDKYETTELGAQSFVWFSKDVMEQTFFKCL